LLLTSIAETATLPDIEKGSSIWLISPNDSTHNGKTLLWSKIVEHVLEKETDPFN